MSPTPDDPNAPHQRSAREELERALFEFSRTDAPEFPELPDANLVAKPIIDDLDDDVFWSSVKPAAVPPPVEDEPPTADAFWLSDDDEPVATTPVESPSDADADAVYWVSGDRPGGAATVDQVVDPTDPAALIVPAAAAAPVSAPDPDDWLVDDLARPGSGAMPAYEMLLPRRRRPPRRRELIIAAVAMVVGLGVIGFALTQGGDEPSVETASRRRDRTTTTSVAATTVPSTAAPTTTTEATTPPTTVRRNTGVVATRPPDPEPEPEPTTTTVDPSTTTTTIDPSTTTTTTVPPTTTTTTVPPTTTTVPP